MIRVLVDLLFYTGTKGGMESYVREVYSRFRADDPELTFLGLASTELSATGAPWFPGHLIDSGISGDNRVAWARGELGAVRRWARRVRADVVHAPANFGPRSSPVPLVITVHDLLAFRHPEWVPGAYSGVIRWMIRGAARAATRVLTVSEASAQDIVAVLGVPRDRVEVIPLAGNPPPRHTAEVRAAIPATVPVHPAPAHTHLVAVGNRMPHKGFTTLLDALALIDPAERPTLTITGSHGRDPLAPHVRRLGLGEWVSLRGWLSRTDLDDLYTTATALVFPSRFEGFGLPPLEAMARGCPVIVSDLPVLHEVTGDAARYINPLDPADIAAAIREVCASSVLRDQMSRAGLVRAATFSWDATATATRAGLLVAASRPA